MSYEPVYWDIGDEDEGVLDLFRDKLKRLVDENVKAALVDYWKNVNIWVSTDTENDDQLVVEAWSDGITDGTCKSIPLADLHGFDAERIGPELAAKAANIFDALAAKARASVVAHKARWPD